VYGVLGAVLELHAIARGRYGGLTINGAGLQVHSR
jgi:hypothetical protein